MTFKQDRIENEKRDPEEASSLKFINVPLVLIALFIGFGVSYLGLRTGDTSMLSGDSRTATAERPTAEDDSSFMVKGKQVYTTTCQACHQSSGAGIAGTFPPLMESEWVSGPPRRLIAILLHGLQGEITVKGQKFQGVMPPFKEQLKSEEIAAALTYVRNSFGNKADAVTADLVNEVKDETQLRTRPWNGEAELNEHKWE